MGEEGQRSLPAFEHGELQRQRGQYSRDQDEIGEFLTDQPKQIPCADSGGVEMDQIKAILVIQRHKI